MAAYRYWRSLFARCGFGAGTNPSGNFACVVVRVYLYDSDGVQKASNSTGIATADAQFSDSYLPRYSFDDDPTSSWASPAMNNSAQYFVSLTFDFGFDVDIASVTWAIETSNAPQGAQMLASHDGVVWDVVTVPLMWPYPTATPTLHTAAIVAPVVFPIDVDTYVDEGATVPTMVNSGGGNESTAPAYSGFGFIAGEVEDSGSPPAPLSRQVRLYSEVDGRLVAVTESAKDGTYRFDKLDTAQPFVAIAFDRTRNYNAAIKDNLKAVLE